MLTVDAVEAPDKMEVSFTMSGGTRASTAVLSSFVLFGISLSNRKITTLVWQKIKLGKILRFAFHFSVLKRAEAGL